MPLRNFVPLVAAALAVLAFTPGSANEPAEEAHGNAHTAHARNEFGVFVGATAGGEAEGGGEE